MPLLPPELDLGMAWLESENFQCPPKWQLDLKSLLNFWVSFGVRSYSEEEEPMG